MSRTQGNGPRGVHFDSGHGAGQFRCAGQESNCLRGWRGNDDVTERAVGAFVRIEQVPVFFPVDQISNPAREIHRQAAQQPAGNCAHARRADPADLLVRRGRQLAVLVVVQMGGPFFGPAVGLPLLDFIDKSAVAGGEVLCSQIKGTGIAALARHTPAAASAFIEKVNRVASLLQCVGG